MYTLIISEILFIMCKITACFAACIVSRLICRSGRHRISGFSTRVILHFLIIGAGPNRAKCRGNLFIVSVRVYSAYSCNGGHKFKFYLYSSEDVELRRIFPSEFPQDTIRKSGNLDFEVCTH